MEFRKERVVHETERHPLGATETTEREFIVIGSDHVQLAYPDAGSGA